MPSHDALELVPAITGLLELFATQPLVALGEVHMLQEQADFITAYCTILPFLKLCRRSSSNSAMLAISRSLIALSLANRLPHVISVRCGATSSAGALMRQSMNSFFALCGRSIAPFLRRNGCVCS